MYDVDEKNLRLLIREAIKLKQLKERKEEEQVEVLPVQRGRLLRHPVPPGPAQAWTGAAGTGAASAVPGPERA